MPGPTSQVQDPIRGPASEPYNQVQAATPSWIISSQLVPCGVLAFAVHWYSDTVLCRYVR